LGTKFSPITEIILVFFGIAFLVSLYWEPSKLIKYFLKKKYLNKFNKKSKLQNEPIDYYAERINLDSSDYKSLVDRGIAYYNNNQYDEAIKDLSLALSINPNSKEALYCRADSYYDKKSFNESIMDYTRLIELDVPNVAEIHASRGNAYLELKQYDLALNDYNKAIELEPYYSLFKFYRAYLFQTTNKFPEAIVDYDSVIELDPNDYVALTNRGEVYYEVGNIVRARLDFMKAKGMGYQDAIDNLKKFNLE
jgi:tetratricopeptide (TPR) repeat protein